MFREEQRREREGLAAYWEWRMQPTGGGLTMVGGSDGGVVARTCQTEVTCFSFPV